MPYLGFVVIFFIFGVVGMTGCVLSAGRGEMAKLAFFFVGTVFIFFIVGYEAFDQGRLAERTLNPAHNYLVKVKKQQGSEIPLLVYDMVDKKDRVIDLKEYPPSEFSEVLTADGKILLVPK